MLSYLVSQALRSDKPQLIFQKMLKKKKKSMKIYRKKRKGQKANNYNEISFSFSVTHDPPITSPPARCLRLIPADHCFRNEGIGRYLDVGIRRCSYGILTLFKVLWVLSPSFLSLSLSLSPNLGEAFTRSF